MAKTTPVPSSFSLRRLTAAAVDALPAGVYTDPATTGLQLAVRAGRRATSRTWLFRYTWRGDWIRMTIGHRPSMSLADARERALKLRRCMDEGIDPRRAENRRRPLNTPKTLSATAAGAEHSIEALAQEFIEGHVKPTRKRPKYAESILARDVLPEWAGRDARTIRPREVVELLDKIVGRGSAVMANRTAALLGQMFRYGIHRAIVEDSPVKLLMRPGGKEKPRERALGEEELKTFLCAPEAFIKPPRLAHAVLVLLLTGQRRGELAAARWEHIDLEANTWTIPAEHSKTGRESLVPLSAWAANEFRALLAVARSSRWVLPSIRGKDPTNPMVLTRGLARNLSNFAKAGIAAFTLHDLRRTCRTGLAKLTVEPHIAERVLNHAQDKMSAVYDTYSYLNEKRAALDKWAAHLASLARGSDDGGHRKRRWSDAHPHDEATKHH